MLQKLIRKKDLKHYCGLSRTAIEERVKAGTFPQPIKIGQRNIAWLETELEAWQQEQIAQNRNRR